jgi:hypothetical protein
VRTSTSGTVSAELKEFRKATALYLSTLALPVNFVGRLPDLTPLPVFGGSGANSFSFQGPVARFLFQSLPQSLAESLADAPRLSSYLASLGVTNAQGLARLSLQPVTIGAGQAGIPGIYSVSAGGKAVPTQLASDGKSTLLQQAGVTVGTRFTVSIVPVDDVALVGTFDGKAVTFDGTNSVEIVAPAVPGTYVFVSSGSPLTLAIKVSDVSSTGSVASSTISPNQPGSPPRPTLWQRVKAFFLGIR